MLFELAPASWEPQFISTRSWHWRGLSSCQNHTVSGFVSALSLAMNMSWCPAVWVSGGLFYGGTQVFSPNFSFIVITKIPLMVKYSMIFQSSNLLITLGFWFIFIIAVWGGWIGSLINVNWIWVSSFLKKTLPNTLFLYIWKNFTDSST